jgi:DNA polymerase-3 subunit epsilon
MRDFAAIDFETANWFPSSVCSIGVAIVRDGRIVDTFYSLIRPAPNWYSRRNIGVHKLTRKDTDTAEDFPAVWAKIAPRLAGLPLAAHNSWFDERCLKAAHKHYALPYPDYKFHCTYRTAQRLFPKPQLPNHQLHTVAEHCGYNLKDHHHALADAEACAVIALQVFKD